VKANSPSLTCQPVGRWRRELLAIQQFDGLAKRTIPGYRSNRPQGQLSGRTRVVGYEVLGGHDTKRNTSPDGFATVDPNGGEMFGDMIVKRAA